MFESLENFADWITLKIISFFVTENQPLTKDKIKMVVHGDLTDEEIIGIAEENIQTLRDTPLSTKARLRVLFGEGVFFDPQRFPSRRILTVDRRFDYSVLEANNVVHGHYITRYPNGNIRTEETFLFGIRYGPYQEYYQDGTRKVTGWYEFGVPTDYWEYRWSNGRLRKAGYYDSQLSGLKIGEWRYYDQQGNLISISNHEIV